MMISLRRVAVVAGIAGVVVVVAACRSPQPDATGPSATTVASSASPSISDAPPDEQAVQIPGLTAILEQYREDEIQGLISVKTTNHSSSIVEFRDLRLRWLGITDTEPYVRSTLVSPGVTFDLRVHQGDAVCGDPPGTDDRPPPDAAVAVGHASIDGAAPPVLVAIPIDDVDAILPKVYQRSCLEQRVRWGADVRFGETWTTSTSPSGEPALLGTIELRRNSSDETLTMTTINGSVLLRISAVSPSDPVAVLGPGDGATTIPIRIEQSGNCDPHALIESKKSFIIPIGLALGDDEPIAYTITFDIPAQRLLNDVINESCGLG